MSNDEIHPVDEISASTETSNDEMDEWLVEIEGRLGKPDNSGKARPSMDSNIEEHPSIFGNWQCWDDFGASFIPENQKWHFVACMRHWFGLNVRSYLEYMQKKEDLAWSYYRGVDEKFRAENSKRFIEHLLVNSCFSIFTMVILSKQVKYSKVILEKINDQNSLPEGLAPEDNKKLKMFIFKNRLQITGYMLTMNYQIPWFVLEAVYTEVSNIGKHFDTPIHKIALSYFANVNPKENPSKKDGGTAPEGGFKHLLHIIHWSRTTDEEYLQDKSRTSKVFSQFHIPSAAALKLSQIVFETGDSIDVSYYDNRRLSRVMKLTPWHHMYHTVKLYESLLKFECQYGHKCGLPFLTYVACMVCLLKTEEDVRVLRKSGVISSTSFDDKDVLGCVQELKTSIPVNLYMTINLTNLEKKVMKHYQRSAYRVYGEFKSRYCLNPWITISVIGAILLFVLTFIQTVVGILSLQKQ